MGSFFDNNPFVSNKLTRKWSQFVTSEGEIYHERQYHKWSRMSHVTIIADLEMPIDNYMLSFLISESHCKHLVFDGVPIYPYSIITQLSDGMLSNLHTLALRNMNCTTLHHALPSLLRKNAALQCLEFYNKWDSANDDFSAGDIEYIFDLLIPSKQVCIRRYYRTDQTYTIPEMYIGESCLFKYCPFTYFEIHRRILSMGRC